MVRHVSSTALRRHPIGTDTLGRMGWRAIVVGGLIVAGLSCSADDSSSTTSSLAPADGCPNMDSDAAAQLGGLLPRSITLDGRTYERPMVEVVASQLDDAGALYLIGNIRDADGTMIVSGAEWAFDGDMLALNDAAFAHSAALEGRTILTAAGEGASSPTLHELRRCAADLPTG